MAPSGVPETRSDDRLMGPEGVGWGFVKGVDAKARPGRRVEAAVAARVSIARRRVMTGTTKVPQISGG